MFATAQAVIALGLSVGRIAPPNRRMFRGYIASVFSITQLCFSAVLWFFEATVMKIILRDLVGGLFSSEFSG
jgi:hypothetical protein